VPAIIAVVLKFFPKIDSIFALLRERSWFLCKDKKTAGDEPAALIPPPLAMLSRDE
jgi:hypothetical protein